MSIFQRIFRRKKLFSVQPADLKMWQAAKASNIAPNCNCLRLRDDADALEEIKELSFHTEVQDTECEAWKLLEAQIEKASIARSKEFAPGLAMQPELWSQIITLPPTIAGLKSVRKLYLYGSHLVRIPVEVGEMHNLEEFDAYTSYRLHWLPYEITRCKKLKRSRISTRALYGNYKYRPPFPKLASNAINSTGLASACSVCGQTLENRSTNQVWISLRVATDVFPLLVNACSEECIRRLPTPANGYVDRPHKGGLDSQQPPTRF